MKKAKKVLCHDDPPCEKALEPNGDCRECGLHPDMQSTAFNFYCPDCNVPLKRLVCPYCKATFQRPD